LLEKPKRQKKASGVPDKKKILKESEFEVDDIVIEEVSRL
jgi:hypothetical protein